MTGGGFDTTFYATAAQVIPVLFVLLAIELRMFSRDDDDAPEETPTRALFLLTLVVLLATSELFSLAVLQERKEPPQIVDAVIFIAFGLSGAAAIGPFIIQRADGLKRNAVTRWGTVIALYASLILFMLSAFGVLFDALVAIGVIALVPFVGFVVASFAEDARNLRTSPPAKRRDSIADRREAPPVHEAEARSRPPGDV